MHNWRVAIVGGGPGGLMTAHALQSRSRVPVDVTIFEASDRFGGKVVTGTFARRPARYEAGAAEFYDYSAVGPDPLKELVLGLGLPIIPMGGSSLMMNGRLLSNGDDVRDVLGPAAALALTRFDCLARDVRGPRDFYFGDAVPRETHLTAGFDDLLAAMGHPAARRYVEQLTHSDLATEPPLTTVTYGLDNYLMNNPTYMSLYAIEGGNEQLMARLDGRLHVRRRLGHRVTNVSPAAARRLRVTAQHDAGVIDDEFDVVVVALPVDHLKRVEFAGPRLDAAMRRHIAHHDHPAHYLRVTLLFDRPFWRRHLRDSFCMLDSFGGCCLYDESSREPGAVHGTLGWLLGGDAAVEMSLLDDDELAAAVLDSLPDMIRHGRHAPLETRVHRWIGGVSAIPGGRTALPLDLRHQPEPVDHAGLFLVGDYLFDSTLNGVLDSAEYVAGWIADLTAARQSAVA